MQSSSTQNDLVASCWSATFLYFGIFWLRSTDRPSLILTALGLAFSFLAKGTTYVVLLPFVLAGILLLQRRAALYAILPVGAICLAINFPHYYRNYSLTGSPLASNSGVVSVGRCSTTDIRYIVLGPLRQALLHLGLPVIQAPLTAAARNFHLALGVDPDSPALTFPGTRFESKGWLRHEDGIGCAVDLVLAGLGVLCISRSPTATKYSACVVLSGFLLSLMIKWQPWGVRLQMPVFVLIAPILGLAVARFRFGYRVMIFAAKAFSVCFILLWNENRPFISASPSVPLGADQKSVFVVKPRARYFVNCQDAMEDFQELSKVLQGLNLRTVGIHRVRLPYLLFALNGDVRWFYIRGEYGRFDPSEQEVYVVSERPQELRSQRFHVVWSGSRLTLLRMRLQQATSQVVVPGSLNPDSNSTHDELRIQLLDANILGKVNLLGGRTTCTMS